MHVVHLVCSMPEQPSLELKVRPKQLLGCLPFGIALMLIRLNAAIFPTDNTHCIQF